MPRVFRKKSDFEVTLSSIVKELGHMPSAKEMSNTLGSDPSGWGRILKRQCEPAGEYHAKLKRVKEVGFEGAGQELIAAERSRKYRWKTRNGRLHLKTKFIAADTELFYIDQIVRKEISEKHFESDAERLHFHRKRFLDIYDEGTQWPKDPSEVDKLRRDFLKSLP